MAPNEAAKRPSVKATLCHPRRQSRLRRRVARFACPWSACQVPLPGPFPTSFVRLIHPGSVYSKFGPCRSSHEPSASPPITSPLRTAFTRRALERYST